MQSDELNHFNELVVNITFIALCCLSFNQFSVNLSVNALALSNCNRSFGKRVLWYDVRFGNV